MHFTPEQWDQVMNSRCTTQALEALVLEVLPKKKKSATKQK
jgi:hypothetical protein